MSMESTTEETAPPWRAARPRPAASLVLVREGPGGPEVLLGRRGAGARFMPGRYVFPGGRVQRSDSLPWAGEAIAADVEARLLAHARAALRETFEETGLLLARPVANGMAANAAPAAGASEVERALALRRLVPALDALRPIGRAITPARSPIRFHARFFLADGALAAGSPAAGEELEDVRWCAVGERIPAPMSDVTRFMLRHALAVWRGEASAGLPLYRYVRGIRRVQWSGAAAP